MTFEFIFADLLGRRLQVFRYVRFAPSSYQHATPSTARLERHIHHLLRHSKMQPRKSKPDWTIANSTATRRRAAAVTNEDLMLRPGHCRRSAKGDVCVVVSDEEAIPKTLQTSA